MRAMGAYRVFLVTAATLAASSAAAQIATKAPSFVVKPEPAPPVDFPLSATGFAPAVTILDPTLVRAVRLIDGEAHGDGAGLVTWRSSVVTYQGEAGGAFNQIRVSMAVAPRLAGVTPLILTRPDVEAYDLRDIDVTVTRGWPSALALTGRKYALDVTPHAGLGFGGAGGSAEAGATLRLGRKQNLGDRVNDALGLREGATVFGDRGRWYIYAAASGRAVGLNLLRGQSGDWTRAGLSQDATSRLIGDSQAGVAWRKGPMQASFGYIHREIRAKEGVLGLATQKDDIVALSFSLKPHW